MTVEPSDASDDAGAGLMLPYPSRRRDLILDGLLAAVGVLAIVFTSGALRTGLVVFVVVMFAGLFGLARSGIRCDALGVARVGAFSSRRFAWSEVDRIEVRGAQGIGVRLVNNGGWIRFIRQSVFGSRTSEVAAQLDHQRELRQRSQLK